MANESNDGSSNQNPPSGKTPPTFGEASPVASTGGLVVQDQILPPNLFILPVNSPLVFPTMFAPILVTFRAMSP